MSKTKYTKELLEPLVENSTSIAQVLKKLGLRLAGGNHSHISKKIKGYDLNTSHFLGQGHRLGSIGPDKKLWQDILIERTEGQRQKAYMLRRALIESGREYKCEICGCPPAWNGKELRLQVDHKNGDWLDDRGENLRFACPNCHSQTPGFSGSKGLSEVASTIIASREYYKKNKDKINAQRRKRKNEQAQEKATA